MNSFVRMSVTLIGACSITLSLCLIAPLISHESTVPSKNVAPVRIQPVPPMVEEKLQVQPKNLKLKPLELPKTTKQEVTNRSQPNRMKLTMVPLDVELPPVMAVSAPALLPQQEVVTPKKQTSKVLASTVEPIGVYELSAVDAQPRLQRYTQPLYPPRAKGKKVEGKVVVRCIVTKRGTVRDAKILSASPTGYFEKAALKAVKKWTFFPARFQGKKVPVYIDIPLTFTLT